MCYVCFFVYKSVYSVYLTVTEQSDREARIRLGGGRIAGSGRIELFDGMQWGTVCDDLFDAKDGGVACVMAGYLP